MTSSYSVRHHKNTFHTFAWYSKNSDQQTSQWMKRSKCSFFSKEIQYLGHTLSATGIWPLPSKTHTIQNMKPPTTPKQVRAFLGLVGYYRKFMRICQNSKTTHSAHQTASEIWLDTRTSWSFSTFEGSHSSSTHPTLPKPKQDIHCIHRCFRWCICRAQLSQEHNGTGFPVAFLSHTFMETQCKWSTTEQEAFGVYYAITKWNYYLQGADIIVRNDHKPLAWFLNGKNTNNKVNRWSLNLPHTTSHLNGSLEPRIRPQIASPG